MIYRKYKSNDLSTANLRIGRSVFYPMKCKGFTLIELVIVLVLVSIIALIAVPMILESTAEMQTGYSLSEQTGQGAQAVIVMTRDIRNLWNVSQLTLAANSLSFTDALGNTVSYAFTNQQLTRNGTVLVNNVSQLTFSYYNATGNTTTNANSVRYLSFSFTTSDQNANETFSNLIFLRNAG